jgi:hypothetical protein
VLTPIVLPFLENLTSEIKIEFGQLILETSLNLLPDLLDAKAVFSSIVNFIRSIAVLPLAKLVLTEPFYPLIQMLLYSEQGQVRSEFSLLLSVIEVHHSVFIKLIPLLTSANEADFFTALLPHCTEAYTEFVDYCMARHRSAACLNALEKLLASDLLPDDIQENLSHDLVTDYLQTECPPREKNAFLAAVRCLNHLQNES